MEFNGPIDFLPGSGQLLAPQGDLILAPGNEVVVSGGQLVPLADLLQNLGDAARRWDTLFAGSGNFVTRPTVGGSGVLLEGEASGGSADYSDGGELAGANRTLGNLDAFDLGILTSGVQRILINASGQVAINAWEAPWGAASGFALSVNNVGGDGADNNRHGLFIRAGEFDGDIALKIQDQDGTFEILEIDGNTPGVAFFSTIQEILNAGRPLYGFNWEYDGGGDGQDINNQFGVYRKGGEEVMCGTFFQDEEDDDESSTTSTTYQNKITLTTPTLTAGRYRIGYSCEVHSDSTSAIVETLVDLNNGTTLAEMSYEGEDSDEYNSFGGFKYVDLAAGVHTVDMDFRRRESSGAVYIRRARLEIWRVTT